MKYEAEPVQLDMRIRGSPEVTHPILEFARYPRLSKIAAQEELCEELLGTDGSVYHYGSRASLCNQHTLEHCNLS